MAKELVTERLLLRPWTIDDAAAALGSYGDSQVARWLVPTMDRVPDEAAMRLVLQQWIAEDARMTPPAGRWAVELREDRSLVGGATLLPLPPDDEYEVGWQLRPDAWGHGYATETGQELARWAFEQGIEQVIAVVRPANPRATAMVRRLGMEWVGETDKYHSLHLQVYRLRPADLTPPTYPHRSRLEPMLSVGDPPVHAVAASTSLYQRHGGRTDSHRQHMPGRGHARGDQKRNQHADADAQQTHQPGPAGQQQDAGGQHGVHHVRHTDIGSLGRGRRQQMPPRTQVSAVLGEQRRHDLPGQRDDRGPERPHCPLQYGEADRDNRAVPAAGCRLPRTC